MANPNFPANNVRELIEYLNKNPGKTTFAPSGNGSSDHLTAALFWQRTGTPGIHVPYRGGGPAINDLIAVCQTANAPPARLVIRDRDARRVRFLFRPLEDEGVERR